MGNPQEIDVAWLAGLIDGEGSFTITKNRYADNKPPSVKAALTIPSTDERIIAKAKRVISEMGIKPYLCEHPPRKRRKRYWVVGVMKLADLAKISGLLLPYLTRDDNAVLMNKYATMRMTGPWIDKGIDPKTGRHKMSRRPLATDEWDIVQAMYANNQKTPSSSSTTTREAARQDLSPDTVCAR